MFAIFKRELRSYFTSLVGYVVIGVMLAFIGLYYSANCLVYGTSDFSTVLYSTTLVMLFLLPALTMRSFADERRNKTDQLLLTSPVSERMLIRSLGILRRLQPLKTAREYCWNSRYRDWCPCWDTEIFGKRGHSRRRMSLRGIH